MAHGTSPYGTSPYGVGADAGVPGPDASAVLVVHENVGPAQVATAALVVHESVEPEVVSTAVLVVHESVTPPIVPDAVLVIHEQGVVPPDLDPFFGRGNYAGGYPSGYGYGSGAGFNPNASAYSYHNAGVAPDSGALGASEYSYHNTGLAAATPTDASAYSYHEAKLGVPQTPGRAYSYHSTVLSQETVDDATVYSFHNTGLSQTAEARGTAYSYHNAGATMAPLPSATVYSFHNVGLPPATTADTTAYSFHNVGLPVVVPSDATSYSFHNAGVAAAILTADSAYSYHSAGIAYFPRGGEAYSFHNAGFPLVSATSDVYYMYESVGFAATAGFHDAFWMYENVGFYFEPPRPWDWYWQYENVGFHFPDVNDWDWYWQYENVGFGDHWNNEEWYGWGVPISSDYTAMDDWYYEYVNVIVPGSPPTEVPLHTSRSGLGREGSIEVPGGTEVGDLLILYTARQGVDFDFGDMSDWTYHGTFYSHEEGSGEYPARCYTKRATEADLTKTWYVAQPARTDYYTVQMAVIKQATASLVSAGQGATDTPDPIVLSGDAEGGWNVIILFKVYDHARTLDPGTFFLSDEGGGEADITTYWATNDGPWTFTAGRSPTASRWVWWVLRVQAA